MAGLLVLVSSFLAQYSSWLQEQMQSPIVVKATATAQDADVCPLLPEAEIVVTSFWTPAMGQAAKRLRFIQLPSAGWEKVNASAIPDGVLVANCYAHERAVAEWVMMMCLALSRELIPADRALHQGDWSYFPPAGHALYPELGGRTLGIIGLGRIGQEVTRLASAFDMRCIAVDVRPIAAETQAALRLAWAGTTGDLPRLLRESDFVVIAVPSNPQTHGLLGRREFALMKPGAFLLNPARAEITEEQALYEALRDRVIAGAALDPWWRYPASNERVSPSRFPLGELQNVIMTPHSAGLTAGTMERRMRVVADNVNRFLRGEPVHNVVKELSRG